MYTLNRLPEEMARFYAAEVILAFEYLHGHDFVYRDLKVTFCLEHTPDGIVMGVTWTLFCSCLSPLLVLGGLMWHPSSKGLFDLSAF